MKKIEAKDCEVKELSYEESSLFFKENMNCDTLSYVLSYGLFFNGVLVKVMLFGKPRYNKYYSWEILRNCNKKNCKIVFGTKKIWDYFVNKNTVRSCICYSYPSNKELFETKYIEQCNFKNIKKSKPAKKIYFEGTLKGEKRKIYKQILERYGVNNLLGVNYGNEETNEQIITKLGFKKKEVKGLDPQIDSYFPSGIVYKITDLDTGKFYIGLHHSKENFINGVYNGSGRKWLEYYNKYKDKHKFKREILKEDFTSPKEYYDFEINEIRKYCVSVGNGEYKIDENSGCMNVKTKLQPEMPVCPECGGLLFRHKKICSMYNKKTCEECGGEGNLHKKTCSKYHIVKYCKECNGKDGHHKKTCSMYKMQTPCTVCGSYTVHKSWCENRKELKVCPECGGKSNHHYKHCSEYKTQAPCSECGSTNAHKKTCSRYKSGNKPCSECGNLTSHKYFCSRYKSKTCEECGGKSGKHNSSCSKCKKCKECGNPVQSHSKNCSNYKKKRIFKICSNCNGKNGHHYKNCINYQS